MKPILSKYQVKHLLGLLAYALIVLGFSFFKEWPWMVGGLIMLGGVTFGVAWAAFLKSRSLVTTILVLSLATAPLKAEAPSVNETGSKNVVLYVCCVVVIGGLLIYATYRICKAIKTIKKNLDNINTNAVVEANGVLLTNRPSAALHMPDRPGVDVLTEDWQPASLTLQNSTDGLKWADRFSMTNWMGSNLVVAVIYSNSVPLQTNMAPVYWTNDPVFLNFSAVMPTNTSEPKMFWRAVER
jgi:hypothetical protein